MPKLAVKASAVTSNKAVNDKQPFLGTLKTKWVYQYRFETRQQAITQITDYIELFYNCQRIQARLGYLSPAAFERRFHQPTST